MCSKIFKKRIGSEFLSKYFPAQSSVCNTTQFPLNEPSQQNQNIYFFLGSIPKSWDFCCMAQENALGRLRPYRLRDCRVFGNMIHLPALWVLSNLLTSSICCSCSLTISRAGPDFTSPHPALAPELLLRENAGVFAHFQFLRRKLFFFAEKNNCRVNIPRLLITQYYKYSKKTIFRFRLLHCSKL